MSIFVRAVITGFGLAMGAALYKRFARRLGIDDETVADAKESERVSQTPVTES